jgi:TM2 domain-containing membrane protein YozV
MGYLLDYLFWLFTGLLTVLLNRLFTGLLTELFTGLLTGLFTLLFTGLFVKKLSATAYCGSHKRMLGMSQRELGEFLDCRQTQQQSCRLWT